MELKCLLLFLLLAGLSCFVSCKSVADVDELTWGEWGECTRTCGGGTQSRRAVCDAGFGPITCLYLKKDIARKQLKEERPCNTQSCIESGTWGNWTDWQPCSSTCGSSVYQMRTRSCYHGNNIQGSWNCDGLPYEWRSCEGLPLCPSNAPSDNHSLQSVEHHELPYSSLQSYDKVSQVVESLPSQESSYYEY